jgi:hypothetical protein
MVLKHSLVVGLRAVEQGVSSPNLDEDVTQGIQSGGVDRAIGGR